ncbi:MAG: GNAT family N-acetyltransferase [Bacteroidota bacterium]
MPDSPDPALLRLRLDDGRPVVLRPVQPSDAPLLKRGLDRLSDASRLTRFFSPLDHLSEQQLDYLTDVDQRTHVAWGALDLSGDEPVGLGIGRFVQLPQEPGVAEVALTVADEAQRHGLGSRLLAVLFHQARCRRIATFRAVLMAQNRPLARYAQMIGGTAGFDEGETTVDLPVAATAGDLPETPEATAFGRVLEEVEAAFAGQGFGDC